MINFEYDLMLNLICFLFFVLGIGKILIGVVLIKLFCNINEEYLKLNFGNKYFVLYCGLFNKFVDLVIGIIFYILMELFIFLKKYFNFC